MMNPKFRSRVARRIGGETVLFRRGRPATIREAVKFLRQKLLMDVKRNPYAPTFFHSLPVSGADTVRRYSVRGMDFAIKYTGRDLEHGHEYQEIRTALLTDAEIDRLLSVGADLWHNDMLMKVQ